MGYNDLTLLIQPKTTPTLSLILGGLNSGDGEWVLSHFINLGLEDKDKKVVLGCFNQSIFHYQSLIRKTGTVLNPASLINVPLLLDSPKLSTSDDILTYLYQSFNNILKNNSINSIIIDDLSILINLGLTLTQVINFLNWIKINIFKLGGDLIVYLPFDENEIEDDLSKLYHRIMYWADRIIKVSPLTTGYAIDIHGQITVHRSSQLTNSPVDPSNHHYQLTESSVNLFAKGTSQATL